MSADGEGLERAVRSTPPVDDVLGSWKEIAVYLQRDVRTVMRWERTRGLPVHRLPGGPKVAVYALRSELETWRAARPAAAGDEMARNGAAGDLAAGGRRRAGRLPRSALVGAAVVLVILATAVGFRLARPGRVASPSIRSLAVLPFQNLSKDPAQDYFADGMHETLITGLARASGVPVTARTSVEHYRGTGAPTRQIARELGVDALVEGSVLRVGNRVRITAQLVRGDTEEHVWANSYDHDVADALTLMAQVSEAITREIRKALASGDRGEAPASLPRTVRPEVLDSYLRARFAFHSMTPEGLGRALALYRETIEMDRDFAPAWNGVAATRTGQAFFGFVPPGDALPEAREAARHALSLDERLGEAHGSLGYIALYWDWNFDDAAGALERAVALSPNNMATRHQYADYLLVRGKAEASLEQVRAGLVTNPMSTTARAILVYHLLMARRYEDAVAEGVAISRSPSGGATWRDYLGRALWLEGRHQEALAEWRAAFEMDDEAFGRVQDAYRRGGAAAAMLEFAQRTAAREPKDLQSGAVRAASLFAAAGDSEHAFHWLEQAYTRREAFLLHVVADPFFDPIRSDARFEALLRRIGIDPRRR